MMRNWALANACSLHQSLQTIDPRGSRFEKQRRFSYNYLSILCLSYFMYLFYVIYQLLLKYALEIFKSHFGSLGELLARILAKKTRELASRSRVSADRWRTSAGRSQVWADRSFPSAGRSPNAPTDRQIAQIFVRLIFTRFLGLFLVISNCLGLFLNF